MRVRRLHRSTARLSIRPFRLEDYEVWKEAYEAMLPRRNRWDLTKRPQADLSRRRFRQLVEGQAEERSCDRYYAFAIFLKKDGSLVGQVSIMDVVRELFQSAYLGYRVFNRHWGRGIAAEAVKAVVDIGFRDLGLHRLEAGIEPTNHRSIRLARTIGMRREGVSLRRLFVRDEWVDLVLYAVTCEDVGVTWKPRR